MAGSEVVWKGAQFEIGSEVVWKGNQFEIGLSVTVEDSCGDPCW